MTGGSRLATEVVPEGEELLNNSALRAKLLDNSVEGGCVRREDEGMGQSRGVTSPKRGPAHPSRLYTVDLPAIQEITPK